MRVSGKNILVGVTGGIAAYKAAILVRELKKLGAHVRVIMTDAATQFIAPLTFETLSESPVLVKMFGETHPVATAHIEWARWPDVIVICPASANTIAKIAHGFADNLLTTTVLASTVPVLLCPAMNVEMYKKPLYQQNEATLIRSGYTIVAPSKGELACGETGVGRLAETDAILQAIAQELTPKTLAAKNILVTAGPTREAIDPVRFICNRSSGKMGYAIAEDAVFRGANVTLISGPVQIKPPVRLTLKTVETVRQMAEFVQEALPTCDVLIMAAAPADYCPTNVFTQKMKKSRDEITLRLEPTEDILKQAGQEKGARLHVGFALETGNGVDKAQQKLHEKNCDLVVLNDATIPGAGFEVDTNKITLLFADGSLKELPLMSKRDAAQHILDAVEQLLAEK